MFFMSNRFLLVFCVLCTVVLVSCGAPKTPPQVFYGKCKIDIESENGSHSEIRMDGIKVGYDKVSLWVPCGEKRVTVVEGGKATYEQYHNVVLGEPLLVKVNLKKVEAGENFALSRKLVGQTRTGQKIDSKAEVVAIKDPAPGSAVSDSEGSSSGAQGGADTKNLNEDGSCAKWCSESDWG